MYLIDDCSDLELITDDAVYIIKEDQLSNAIISNIIK